MFSFDEQNRKSTNYSIQTQAMEVYVYACVQVCMCVHVCMYVHVCVLSQCENITSRLDYLWMHHRKKFIAIVINVDFEGRQIRHFLPLQLWASYLI